ncbi:MAG: amidoligase family protein [Myxococcaceae bacterium]|nr:amidoligase family protein [Myxococcaceae bacterium]
MGLELELLAPPSQSRVTFARALARRVKGRVEYGFKYWSEGTLAGGRPLCRLSLAARVLERDGRVLATLVDDNTLHGGLPAAPRARTLHATDDLRLALLVERLGWGATAARRPEPVKALFGGFVEAGTLHDAFGHPLVVTMEEPVAHHRVCEVVTRPLEGPGEREAIVGLVLEVADALGCTVPPTAALHAHYDAAPWRSVRALRRLILTHATQREQWWRALSPNPRCLKLGPFPPAVVRVARARRRVPFRTFAAALSLAGVSKACDLNVLGVIEPHPRQPTLEVRCLPMSLDPVAVLRSLGAAEALLTACRRW